MGDSLCHPSHWLTHVNVNNVNNLLAISESDFDNSGEPGPQAEGVNHLETPPQTTAHNSQGLLLCSARWSRAIVFETQGGTRNRTRDLPRKGSAFILSSDHWMPHARCWCASSPPGYEVIDCAT